MRIEIAIQHIEVQIRAGDELDTAYNCFTDLVKSEMDSKLHKSSFQKDSHFSKHRKQCKP